MIRSAYTWLFNRLIVRSDPERAHDLGVGAIAAAGSFAPARRALRATLGHLDGSCAPRRVVGSRSTPLMIGPRRLRGRLGLAAGMDKDAEAVLGLDALGFAFVEVGTITPRPQPGNERPRLWRLVDERGIRNRMGFNNEGAGAAAVRLRDLRRTRAGRGAVVGANIGKNKTTPANRAPADYEYCARLLSPWVDFVVVNVSSPNTPGLRDLQSADLLRPILLAARRGCLDGAPDREVPLFVKIAPDLSDEEIIEVVALTRELGLAGVVATNTTIDHDLGPGGVSGEPLFERALEVVRLVALHLADEQLLIGTGGISTPRDAQRMLDAGADLVEGFSAFIYQGPSWPGEVNRALARR
ncbi:quinone-dependent dihydroorotate dehydrogenase [Actinomyces sp. B33]|uniref:quinone-dependent dihydroorotate dehydrogenase n=1 Tax=Actinomyces sp. B33 TaxID=2942131 RepID=UPI0023419DF5|nr:quinone-dependent dihydroorotate dehydrogenase [Actinomyces sp. B33]MDC4232929.1 quinone-dependent dihydroorotate dehydrogenase [Actinomyces sp. B33]